MAAGNSLPKNFPDLAFPTCERGGELEVGAEETMIDGPDLDAGARVSYVAIRSAEPCHARYHVRWAIMRRDKRFVNSRSPTSRRRSQARAACRTPGLPGTDRREYFVADN